MADLLLNTIKLFILWIKVKQGLNAKLKQNNNDFYLEITNNGPIDLHGFIIKPISGFMFSSTLQGSYEKNKNIVFNIDKSVKVNIILKNTDKHIIDFEIIGIYKIGKNKNIKITRKLHLEEYE
jgi:hypothetical protein